ncbi:hypothetical protein PRZ48_006903 [Zasmidium cellare]|uniref:N-acetyltransferase domain-containing protein n=1 Tax=Zasmidium cellare TaxID=395010 RepID=A0ABR0EHW3_ZASCE|nr:hypothetical protein PRZ48_006903 [Zasmidium cellare]
MSHSNPNFTLQPLQEPDIPRCVTIYFTSFQNAHSHGCWPRSPAVRAWWETMLRDELHEPGANWLTAKDVSTGEIAGFCKWVEPAPGKEPDETLPRWPEGADEKLCNETFGAWARRKTELMGRRGFWYLEIIATDPAYQGKGAGSSMLRWGTQRADEQNVESYLEASPDAVALYKKFKFEEADKIDTFIDNERVKATWYRNLFMIRRPQS